MKYTIAKYMLTSLTILFYGCATTEPRMSFEPPKYVEELPSKEEEDMIGNLGSLFGQGENPLFSDRKAMKVNDIVTVIISESTTTTSSAKKSTSENSNFSFSGPNIGYNGANNNRNQTINGVLSNANELLGIGINGPTSNNTFSGSGSNERKDSFTTTISARIIKVLSNGNYYIEGSREILLDGEKQIIRIAGVIRPFDIDQRNRIDSKYIADAKIYYETQGEIKKATEPGWMRKVISTISPF